MGNIVEGSSTEASFCQIDHKHNNCDICFYDRICVCMYCMFYDRVNCHMSGRDSTIMITGKW